MTPTSAPASPTTAIPDFECLDVEQVAPAHAKRALDASNRPLMLLAYIAVGMFLGFLFVQSEVISWYRIYEMFRFRSVHMYGIIGSAVVVGALSLQLIRRLGVTTLHGEPIVVQDKEWGSSPLRGARYWMGGSLFGVGWALTGACPGPMFALSAIGVPTMLVALAAAVAGTWAYALVQHKLPH